MSETKIDLKTALSKAKAKSSIIVHSKYFIKNDEKSSNYEMKNLPMQARFIEEHCKAFLTAVMTANKKKLTMNDLNNTLNAVLNKEAVIKMLS